MYIKKITTTLALFLGVSVTLYAQNPEKSPKEKAFLTAYHERDSIKVIELGEAFLKDYPESTADFKADKAAGISYSKIYMNLITRAKVGVDTKIKQYYDQLNYFTTVELYYRQVYLFHLHKLKPAEVLLPRSEVLLKKLNYFRAHKPVEMTDMPEDQWLKTSESNYFGDLLTHISLLRVTGHTQEALTIADEALSHYGYTIAALNEDVALLLKTAGLKEKLKKALENSVHANQATVPMLDMLREIYLASNENSKNFDAYVESLKSQEGKADQAKEIAASMIKKKIPTFALSDSKGQLVDTKDLKGKIVVLDFFASWCVPCKAAFPGMKMAMEKLADQKDVLFYYIDNQEHGGDYKTAVMKYMKDNNFPFNVLFDNIGTKGMNNEVVNLLGITAIPRKMILDKNGYVRFDTDSYWGSPSKLADEIKIVVELIQKEG